MVSVRVPLKEAAFKMGFHHECPQILHGPVVCVCVFFFIKTLYIYIEKIVHIVKMKFRELHVPK